MLAKEYISVYFNQPCKFRMQNGNVIFGVLWQETFANEVRHYFASTSEHKAYLAALKNSDFESMEGLRTLVELASFAMAIPLSDRTEAA